MGNEKGNILKLLLENKGEEFSIRRIAQIRKINYKTAYQNIQLLEKEKVINVNKKGNISLCSFNNQFNDLVYLVEYKRRENLLENKNLKIIYNRLKTINQQFILLLFGSYTRKTQTKHSDIDLLLISDNPKKIQEELDLLPFNIHLTVISYKEFIDMLKTKEKTVVSEAVKNNIILFGIEDYYRLIENAK